MPCSLLPLFPEEGIEEKEEVCEECFEGYIISDDHAKSGLVVQLSYCALMNTLFLAN